MKIGLFFGSFNPIHVGHLLIGNTVVEHTDLQQVWYVVSPQNPFKKKKNLLHEQDRFDMVYAAIYDNINLRVSDIEFKMPRPSYTIDTLTYLAEKHPQHEFSLILGEDNLKHFDKWKNHEQILEYYNLLVIHREDGSEQTAFHQHEKVRFVDAPQMALSATYIRNAIKNGKSIRYLVHPEVESLIKRKGFYQ
jgi:nicotinate-nucleotide adenylyltransferase